MADNLVLEAPDATAGLPEMISRTERGLLLTCLWYIREVDPQTLLLTGLTRDGVYRVEGGEVTGAVNNFRLERVACSTCSAGSARRAAASASSPREWSDYFTAPRWPRCGSPTSTCPR